MAKTTTFATRLLKGAIKNDMATIAEDGILGGDIEWYVDTGSYILNALISGSIFGGAPANNVTAIAGKPGVGKTYYAIEMAKQFQDAHKDGVVLYFESEGAIRKEMLEGRGMDTSRVVVIPVVTIEEFRHQLINLIDKYNPETDPKIFVVLDSLGNLSTTKEVTDMVSGSEKRDMTRAQLIKGAFRVITLKSAQKGIPIVLTNHTYTQVGQMHAADEMAGGCFVAGTDVIMEGGSIKPIEKIQVGDSVKTGPDGQCDVVLETHTFDDKEIFQIELDDGSVVECTGEHKFAVGVDEDGEPEWVDAKTLHELSKFHDIDLVEVG